MARDSAIPPESFDEILAWLNPDRDLAGSIYVQLREDLTKIFTWNRCPDPEGLTDEVFDRVAKKIHHLRDSYVGDPKLYFYGVARNLIKEIPKKVKMQMSLQGTEPASDPRSELEQEAAAMREDCLRSCLQKLSEDKRELILAYYAKEKQAKIDHRTEMAQRLGISVETLRVKAYRIRGTLEQCIERCLERMAQNR
ncbi:MAG TPA: sigma-70 family RNA polymerase sigma factor [Pyrinomonadaceae bacterium]|nr:sigma-70 family RNA polymerase sigma factor [Pyrinomonadaceae bacterium]